MATFKDSSTINGDAFVGSKVKIIKQTVRKHKQNTNEPVLFDLNDPIPEFTGRKTLLSKIRFSEKISIVNITGPARIGKTQLARKFIFENKSKFLNIIWINAIHVTTLEISLKNLHQTIWKIDCKENCESLAKKLYAYLSKKKTLLVFDHASVFVKKFLPSSDEHKNISILITSKTQIMEGDSVQIVPVSSFTKGDAEEFVKKLLNEKKEHIQELCKLLECHPDSLQKAASCIKEKQKTYKDNMNEEYGINTFMNEYEKNPGKLNTVCEDFVRSIEELKKMNSKPSDLALELLWILAFLSPDDIIVKSLKEQFLPTNDNDLLNQALEILKKFSLVQMKEGKVIIRKVLQDGLRTYLEKSDPNFDNLRKCLTIVVNEKQKVSKNNKMSVLLYALDADLIAIK